MGFWSFGGGGDGRWGRRFLLLFMGIVREMNYDYDRVDVDVVGIFG